MYFKEYELAAGESIIAYSGHLAAMAESCCCRRILGGKLSAAKVTFGAELKDNELYLFILTVHLSI